MSKDDLKIKGKDGKTALVVAINTGKKEMVKCMVRKDEYIVRIRDGSNRLPVVLAYRNSFWDIARYLYSKTPVEDLNGSNGATLVSQCFYAKQYDIAWDLIHRCPSLITTKDLFGESPLLALASVPAAFQSGMQLIFWKKWIYNRIQIPDSPDFNDDNDTRITIEDGNDNIDTNNNNTIAISTLSSIFHKNFIWSGINHIYEMKLVHTRSTEFLNCMCDGIKHLNDEQMKDGVLQSSVLRAVERGIPEFVIGICNANRELARGTNEMGRSIFHYAIKCRQEKVYNLIYGHDMRNAISSLTDAYNNNMLHMAALLSPFAQLNRIPSAALQMQRELQWFKEVETVVAPKAREFINWTDYMTPRDLFTKHHKNLLKEGEKWMKDTATSFTVVGALIVTLMFATAFTVPGGYKEDTGFPIFINERLFMVFIISDAISLFSATTSSLMFLGILTSRYAEDDFLKSLPTKMIIGLFTLFFSIATMMIAFSAALILILQEKPWTAIPIILLSCVPVTLFAVIKIPLLIEIILSTYGQGIFDKNCKKWLL
ncbi:putative ankyrin repeat-containing domain, PGG domain-containing protein [Rosa chinensis]|uniref:Putative ankyrin repeat-containing domain, PGG domain-containing protein n=1 Tax=Rosa chinensis TaxID=74649 RepID=A0A2P6SBY2_ROSCH|nr:putative ankyrin repeat-containing domain, PGG domain-containing protein [Rosa chinensis]